MPCVMIAQASSELHSVRSLPRGLFPGLLRSSNELGYEFFLKSVDSVHF